MRSLAVTMVLLITSCVTTQSGNYPTLPASTWQLYKNLEIGYALTLPRSWEIADLGTQLDRVVVACAPEGPLRDDRRRQIEGLHSRGVQLFACDVNRAGDRLVPLAYAVRSAAPAEGIDKLLDNSPQVAGREVMLRRHASTNSGDMVIVHVHERGTLPDGTAHDLMQYQFFVVKPGGLYFLFVEFPTSIEDTFGKDADLIGMSFTPIR